MTFANKKVLLALANPPAERWLAAKMKDATIRVYPTENSFAPDVMLVAARSSIGKVSVGLDDLEDVVTSYVAHAPVVAVVAEAILPELQQAGVPDECFILPEEQGVPVRGHRVYDVLEGLVEKDLRLEPVVFGTAEILESSAVIKNKQLPQEENKHDMDFSSLASFADKIIIFNGPGAGKTTLAASFAAHLSGLSEPVFLIDLGSPPALRLQIGNPQLSIGNDGWKEARTEWGSLYVPTGSIGPEEIVALMCFLAQDGYVVVDALSELPAWLVGYPATFVDVIDDDMRTLEMLEYKPAHILVANRISPANTGTWPYVVEKTFGKKPDVVIEEDSDGVSASLAGYLPSGIKSRAVADGAAAIGRYLRGRGERH